MKNYSIVEVFENNKLIDKFAFNFLSRGINHSQKKLDHFSNLFKESKFPKELKINFRIFYNATFAPHPSNQLRISKEQINGFVSKKIVKEKDLIRGEK